MIQELFVPAQFEINKLKNDALMNSILFLDASNFDLSDIDIAIFGIEESKNAIGNEGCKNGSIAIRENLYTLIIQNKNIKVADLGNLPAGMTLADTEIALKEITETLLKNNIIPIIIGGGKENAYAIYKGFESTSRNMEIVNITPEFDLREPNYLWKICTHEPNYLFNINILAYQSYYVEDETLHTLQKMYFEANRLGWLKKDISETEPMLRNADYVNFDISAIKQADAPGNALSHPNGLLGEEACQLAWYTGVSDKVKVFSIFEYNPEYDNFNQTGMLISQMIWYFIDGFYNRKNDHPHKHNDFIKYRCTSENDKSEAVFYKSKLSDRWWMEIPYPNNYGESGVLIPCSYNDYLFASKGNFPERFWRGLHKLSM